LGGGLLDAGKYWETASANQRSRRASRAASLARQADRKAQANQNLQFATSAALAQRDQQLQARAIALTGATTNDGQEKDSNLMVVALIALGAVFVLLALAKKL
jgi:hypothetical protein